MNRKVTMSDHINESYGNFTTGGDQRCNPYLTTNVNVNVAVNAGNVNRNLSNVHQHQHHQQQRQQQHHNHHHHHQQHQTQTQQQPTVLSPRITFEGTNRSNNEKHTVHWFRKGLRLHDNPSLVDGIRASKTFRCIFVLDPWFAGSSNVGINKWRLKSDKL